MSSIASFEDKKNWLNWGAIWKWKISKSYRIIMDIVNTFKSGQFGKARNTDTAWCHEKVALLLKILLSNVYHCSKPEAGAPIQIYMILATLAIKPPASGCKNGFSELPNVLCRNKTLSCLSLSHGAISTHEFEGKSQVYKNGHRVRK